MATPSQELQRKLAYLAAQGNDSVLTGGVTSARRFGGGDDKTGKTNRLVEAVELLSRQQQILELNERLAALDRESLIALREAEERLEEIRRNANRTIDGRLVFEDKNGILRDEHGAEIGSDQIDRSQWRPEAESWEAFQEADRRVQEAKDFREQVTGAQERLDGGNLSETDLDELERAITALETAGPGDTGGPAEPQQAAEREMEVPGRSVSAARDYTGDPALDVAALRLPFGGAATGPAPAAADPPGTSSRPDIPIIPR